MPNATTNSWGRRQVPVSDAEAQAGPPATGVGALISRLRHRVSDSWTRAQERRPALKHAASAYARYNDNRGNFLAAGLTYYSFLALFPLVFVAVSISGFVLSSRPDLVQKLDDSIVRNVPGDFGDVLKKMIDTAIADRASVGLFGIVIFAWAGLGWMANVRIAVNGVWGVLRVKSSFLHEKAADAIALIGMGAGVVLSFGVTALGTALSDHVASALGLGHTTIAVWAVKIVGIVLAIAGDMVVFGWTMFRLAHVTPSRQTALRTALLAGIGVEVLKLAGTYYLKRIAQSPVSAALGAVVGVLVFMYLLARFLLYCAAWAAEAEPAGDPEPEQVGADASA